MFVRPATFPAPPPKPSVVFVNPAPSASETPNQLQLQFQVVGPEAQDIVMVSVLVNGKRQTQFAPMSTSVQTKVTQYEGALSLTPGVNTIAIVATTKDGASNDPSSIKVVARAPN
jgi:hypothetical protein